MILTINKNNLKSVCEVIAISVERSSYNSECFSSKDIIRHTNINKDVDNILRNIAQAGINISNELKNAFNKLNVNYPNDWFDDIFEEVKTSKEDFNVEVHVYLIHTLFSKDNLYFNLFEDRILEPINHKNYMEYKVDFISFPMRKYKLNVEDTLDYLCNSDSIFKEGYLILKNELNNYNITAISSIHDESPSDTYGSYYKVECYCNNKNEFIYTYINSGGYHPDVVLVKDKKIIKVLPLVDRAKISCHKPRLILSEEQKNEIKTIREMYFAKQDIFKKELEKAIKAENFGYINPEVTYFDSYNQYINEYEKLDCDVIKLMTEEEFNTSAAKVEKERFITKSLEESIIGKELEDSFHNAMCLKDRALNDCGVDCLKDIYFERLEKLSL